MPGQFDAGPVVAREEGQDFAVLVAYAHTPDSLDNVLAAARRLTAGRVISVFGAGGDRDRDKRPKMGQAGAEGSDLAIVTSDNPRSEDPEAIIAEILAGIPAAHATGVEAIEDRRAAIERGKATFYRRVGERNHACADCHTSERGASKFLGGRFLGDATTGLTRHFPTWRTNQNEVWDMRKRMQWCMTPLGTNMLAADAVEYAELELFLASFDQGKPLSVPGIRH